MAFLTDSSPQSTGLIVVDLASGKSWRRLHEQPSTKAEAGFLPIAEGQPLMLRPPHGLPKPYRSEVDGVAISHDGARLLWPDTLSLATDGYLYFTVNQLHRGPRFHQGEDLRERPFGLFRVRVDASPVLLRSSSQETVQTTHHSSPSVPDCFPLCRGSR